MSVAKADRITVGDWRAWARFIGFALAYIGGAELGHWLSAGPTATFWPPSGLYLALLLLSPLRDWPVLGLAALTGNLVSDVLLHDQPVLVSLGFAAANALAAFSGAGLLRRLGDAPFRLDRLNAVLNLAVVSGALSAVLSATAGAAVIAVAFDAAFWPSWKSWWVADMVGILLVAPLALTFRWPHRLPLRLSRILPLAEGVALLAGLSVVAFLLFWDHYDFISPPFLVLPFLLWAALRFGLGGVATALAALALVAIRATVTGHGPFARPDLAPAQAIFLTQLFLSICALCFLTLAALMQERQQAYAAARAANDALGRRVQQRTLALEAAAEQRRLALAAAALGAWDYNPLTGAMNWDRRMRELFGLEPNDPLGCDHIINALTHPDDRARMQAAGRRALDPRCDGRYDIEYRIVTPAGAVRWLALNGQTVFEGVGSERRATRMLGVARDITARVESDQALRENMQRLGEAHALLDAFFAAAPIGMAFWNRELQFVRVNDRLAEINGLPAAAHIGKTPTELLPGIADIERLMDDWRRLLTTGEPLPEIEIRGETPAQPSKLRYWREDFFPVRLDGAVIGVGAVVEEITDRKAAEQALRESESRFRQLADAAPAMLWVTDRDGACVFLSKGWRDFTGQTAAAGLGDGWLDAIHPDYRSLFQQTFLRANRRQEPFEIDYPLRCADGAYRWAIGAGRPRCADNGDCLGFVGSVIDITARKQAEQALQESEERFRLAARAVVGMIYDWDVNSGYVYRSEGLLQLVGVPAQAAPPTQDWWLERIHPDDLPRIQETTRALLRGRSDRCELEYRVRHADGRWIDIWDNSYFMRAAAGTLTRVVGNAADITARVEVERALHEARAAADAANQAKSEFLANMSHEIRTPMAAILGYADILAAHCENADDLQMIDTIQRNGRHLLDVINDILDLSKIEAGRLELTRERFSPAALIADARALMAVRAQEKGLTLAVEFAGLLPARIDSDPRRLKQILINLLGNAIKFTRAGGVTLSVRLREDEPTPLLEFAVRDTGIGIPSAQLGQLFQPFTQLDNSATREYGGSGLGLVISRRLTQLLGGDITVESEWGRGSVFTFTVATGPLTDVARVTPAAEVTTQPRLSPPSVRLAGRVLVVDDRADIRQLAQRYLEEAGAEVEQAGDGVAALAAVTAAEAAGRPFAALLLDMQMPALDGYTVARRLRAQGFKQPIVALTAHTMKGDREKCLAAGCDEFFGKPIERGQLLALLDRLLRPVAPTTAAATPVAPGRCRVLVVDDNSDAADALALMLAMLGYEATAAYDGATALAAAQRQAPDVAIVDINLPDMNGYVLVSRLKNGSACRRTVFIALSGEDEASGKAQAAGFDHYVLKPASVHALTALFPFNCAPSLLDA